jgi:tRNA modification GTPase
MHVSGDTIAAIATSEAPSALGIVRISGPYAARIVDQIVPGVRPSSRPRRVFAGHAIDPVSKVAIDEVLTFYCQGPGTATGENTAEIQGHGGPVVLQQLLNATISAGARPAEPGEFSYRAFVNGRLDLSQAEAIMGLIGARSERAARVALGQLRGSLGKALNPIFDEMLAISSEVEAGLDFPDEDLPLQRTAILKSRLEKLAKDLTDLSESYSLGSRLQSGIQVAIIGPPNAGKSSLMNRLVGTNRALVDHEPGTTRDVVEASGQIAGIPLQFLDTAGIRDNAGRVEKHGIEKTIDAAVRADLVIIVLDGTVPPTKEGDQELSSLLSKASGTVIVAVNKADLPSWKKLIHSPYSEYDTIRVSALTGEGVDHLIGLLENSLGDPERDENNILSTTRQHTAIVNALKQVLPAIKVLHTDSPPELAAENLRLAREELAALLGRTATEDLLTTMFSNFCIGK